MSLGSHVEAILGLCWVQVGAKLLMEWIQDGWEHSPGSIVEGVGRSIENGMPLGCDFHGFWDLPG